MSASFSKVAILAAAGSRVALAFDMGPTYGSDYAGLDYNITMWNTPANESANHFQASALRCEQNCLADPNCCAWTYCPPGSGDAAAAAAKHPAHPGGDESGLGERCCLKSKVPRQEKSGDLHWTGLPPRAVVPGSDNNTLSDQCDPSVLPPYPGPAYAVPKVHHSPDCLHLNGWHDVAGALTFKEHHHVFQGCPASSGWSHAHSTDLVHWDDRGIHVKAENEMYEGMHSDVSPCSGFVAINDAGVPCAGFRQCNSDKGTTGLNPDAQPWDVPLEVRCAENENLTQWGDNQYLYPVYYYRALPYDPVRPWKDTDGRWYSALSTDGCNATTHGTPCLAGGRLDLFVADKFAGPWTQMAPLFTTNTTYRGANHPQVGSVTGEFVTSGYFGNMTGDPSGDGTTRVVTQNRAGATYWVGKQADGPGSPFVPFWDKPGAVGFYDYGSLTMARTLGADPNQVAVNGRRVLVGWIGGTPAAQSLARDLTLSDSYELLQQFVPELQVLRLPSTGASFQYEAFATFQLPATGATGWFGLRVMSNGANGVDVFFRCTGASTAQECTVGVDATDFAGGKNTSAPLYVGAGPLNEVSVHVIVDGQIIEAIFNNRTAMVVYQTPPSTVNTEVATKTESAGGVQVSAFDTWDLAPI